MGSKTTDVNFSIDIILTDAKNRICIIKKKSEILFYQIYSLCNPQHIWEFKWEGEKKKSQYFLTPVSFLGVSSDSPKAGNPIKPSQHYHWIGDDKRHPAHNQESAENDRGHVFQHRVHRSFWPSNRLSKLLLNILWNSRRHFCCRTFNYVNNLRGRKRSFNCVFMGIFSLNPTTAYTPPHSLIIK